LGDIARQISAGLRCDSKKLKALQKSHRVPHKRARMTPHSASEFHRRRRREIIFLVMSARAILESFHFRRFLLWRWVKAHRRAPRSTAPSVAHRRQSSGASSRARRVRVEPRSSCRACQNGGAGPRMIRRGARSARARSRAAAATSAAGSLAGPAIR
jgi:hypothetical protein